MPKIEMGKQYRTRDGRPVRILCVDYKSAYTFSSVIGVYGLNNVKEMICTWNEYGKYADITKPMKLDLIEVRPRIKRTVWVNVYQDTLSLSTTRERADNIVAAERLACVQVEIDCEEGEGLDK